MHMRCWAACDFRTCLCLHEVMSWMQIWHACANASARTTNAPNSTAVCACSGSAAMLETGEWYDAPEQLSAEGTPPATPPKPPPYSGAEASQAAQTVYIKPAASVSAVAQGMQPPGVRCCPANTFHL
jgi:hypothetical protein